MWKLLFFLLCFYLLTQSTFYKEKLFPVYKKIEASLSKLLDPKPDALKTKEPKSLTAVLDSLETPTAKSPQSNSEELYGFTTPSPAKKLSDSN